MTPSWLNALIAASTSEPRAKPAASTSAPRAKTGGSASAPRAKPSPIPQVRGEVREFPRFDFRALATATIYPLASPVAKLPQECFVVTRNLSRGGIAILHPRPLAPEQHVDLILSDGRELSVRVRWCRRLDERCYLIGCRFMKVSKQRSGAVDLLSGDPAE
jgi:hypothetical protein